MPDLTISVTDAQWARIVAVSSYIKGQSGKGETGDVDSAYIVAKLKAIVGDWVIDGEKIKQTVDDF